MSIVTKTRSDAMHARDPSNDDDPIVTAIILKFKLESNSLVPIRKCASLDGRIISDTTVT